LSVTEVVLPSGNTSVVRDIRRHEVLGLNEKLWRLALVAGIAQLSISIWTWQFTIFLDTFLTPLDIGLTFTFGTIASLIGYPISGTMGDMIGRKRTMAFAFFPLCVGLFFLYLFPIWPFVIASYSLTQFGWSFIIIISRAMPADEIANNQMLDPTRKFTMVLMPAFLLDGLSPILAVFLLNIGVSLNSLLLVGVMAGIGAFLLTVTLVQETLPRKVKQKARKDPKIPIRRLGQSFWLFTGGMIGYYIAWGLAIPYIGPLCVDEWGIDLSTYGMTWSAFSLTSVILMYGLSGFADRSRRKVLIVSLFSNAIIMILFGFGSGVFMMFILNIVWSAPIVLWIGLERTLAIDGVTEQFKGRALATYQFIMSVTSVIATPLGAMIWEFTSSLRMLWILAGLLAILSIGIIYWSSYADFGFEKTCSTSNQ
jgi:MFS family permease